MMHLGEVFFIFPVLGVHQAPWIYEFLVSMSVQLSLNLEKFCPYFHGGFFLSHLQLPLI